MPISMPIFWLIALIAFVVIEAATLGLTSIWFAFGSLLALIASLFHWSLAIQIVLFAVGSVALLLLTRPLAGKMKLGHVKTNADRVVGQEAIVTQRIDNLQAQGQVRVGGQIWTARSQNDTPIEEGKNVKILQISGVKLIVCEEDKQEEETL